MAIQLIHPQWGENRPIRGVLFDMDGLVVNTEVLFSRFWREACAEFGFSMSYEKSLCMRALGRELGQEMLTRFFGPGADYNALRNVRIARMEAWIDVHGVDPKPGIFPLMEYLHSQGIPAAITSSSPVDRIQKYLRFHGLDTAFSALCSGRDTPRGKPEPDIYLHGAAALGLDPRDCLALEDAPAGILSAYRAGCLSVMVPDLDQPDEQTTQLLYARADTLADIIHLIQTQNGHQ